MLSITLSAIWYALQPNKSRRTAELHPDVGFGPSMRCDVFLMPRVSIQHGTERVISNPVRLLSGIILVETRSIRTGSTDSHSSSTAGYQPKNLMVSVAVSRSSKVHVPRWFLSCFVAHLEDELVVNEERRKDGHSTYSLRCCPPFHFNSSLHSLVLLCWLPLSTVFVEMPQSRIIIQCFPNEELRYTVTLPSVLRTMWPVHRV